MNQQPATSNGLFQKAHQSHCATAVKQALVIVFGALVHPQRLRERVGCHPLMRRICCTRVFLLHLVMQQDAQCCKNLLQYSTPTHPMSDFVRDRLGLTQERLASWLGVNRTTLASSETGRRSLPLAHGVADARLTLAVLGRVLGEAGATTPAPPPLPPPVPDYGPLTRRLANCRYQAGKLRRQLAAMRAKASQLEARLAALPALRAYAGPVKNPAREAGWLALLEGEAVDGLREDCGAGPQQLLTARLGGLEREIELLESALPGLQVAP